MRALVPIANGTEDIEAVTVIDVLRRAQVEVTVASIEHDLTVTLAKGCKLTADVAMSECKKESYDLVAVPGGSQGAAALAKNKILIEKLKDNRSNRRWYAAICAAPAMVLAAHDLLEGKRATCYPAFKNQLPRYVDAPVVVDGHCITGQAAGASIAWALKIVELTLGEDKARNVAEQMLVPMESLATA